MLLSIIMPVYNNEKYFPIAVKSILEQSYADFELIIVDDGSTDNTPLIADGIAKSDRRVKVIHQKNQWIFASYNNGIQNAQGEYVFIVNSDDKLRPGALELMAEKAVKYNVDIIWTKVLSHLCDQNQNIIKYDRANWNNKLTEDVLCKTSEEVRRRWPFFYFSGLAQNQINLYRRELMVSHPFRNDRYGADTLFNIDIASDIESALALKTPIYDHFVYNNDGLNASLNKYYDYEHQMNNEIHLGYKQLFEEWRLPYAIYREEILQRRLKSYTNEIKCLLIPNCPLSTEEKIKKVFVDYLDDTVLACALELDKQEELEARVLSGTREILTKEVLPQDSEMYFVYELLDSLLRYEKDEDDYRKIEKAINHPLNPEHIGKIFFEKLKRSKITMENQNI